MDPLERRIQAALTDDRWRVRPDLDLLARVHAGARRRRRRRVVAVGAVCTAAAVVVAVGIGSVLLPGRGQAPLTATTGPATPSQQPTSAQTSSPAPSVTPSPTSSPAPSPAQTTPPRHQALGGTVPADLQVDAVTAISGADYWVLGSTPGCASSTCVTVAFTGDGGQTFQALAAPPATLAHGANQQSRDTISSIRFVDQSDGWAFGYGLWATHDGGRSWTRAAAVPGDVLALEAYGPHVYALVRQQGSYSLWRSEIKTDSWAKVPVKLHAPTSLGTAGGVVAVTDNDGKQTSVLVSTDAGQTWTRRATPCIPDLSAGQLSVVQDTLWLSCPSGTLAEVYASTTAGRSWQPARLAQGPANSVLVAGLDGATAALLEPNGVVTVVSTKAAPVDTATLQLAGPAGGGPAYLGFTNTDDGYAIGLNGALYRSSDGGHSWQRVAFG